MDQPQAGWVNMKKGTLVLLILFILSASAYLLIQQKPEFVQPATPTTAATAMPKLLNGFEASEVNVVEIEGSEGETDKFTRSGASAWLDGEGNDVAGGKVEEMLSELLATTTLVILPEDTPLSDVGLDMPAYTIHLQTDTSVVTLKVGDISPTRSGYYVTVDSGNVVLVSKYAIEAVFQLLQDLHPTPVTTSTVTAPTP